MSLKDLERLTGELEELTVFLMDETEPYARRVIFARVQEIIAAVSLMNGPNDALKSAAGFREFNNGSRTRPETAYDMSDMMVLTSFGIGYVAAGLMVLIAVTGTVKPQAKLAPIKARSPQS